MLERLLAHGVARAVVASLVDTAAVAACEAAGVGAQVDEPPPADAAIWVSTSNHHHGGPISSQAIADLCAKRLKISKVHRLRHTFAWTMEQNRAKLSEIQRRRGHKNIATTSLYLQALMNEENPYAEAIERAMGVEEKS